MKFRLISLAALVCLSGSAHGQKMKLRVEDRRPEAIIDEATPETALAVNQLQLPDGIEATLWAAEPMLANPVAFAFDEKGKLFVSETHRYRSSVLDIRHYFDMYEEDMAFRSVDDRDEGIKELFGDEYSDFEIESEVVRLIEDRDGDGVADFSSAYADGFNSALSGIASGVLARKGKVYFINIPSLWEIEGMDDQGKSTSRRSMHRGFGVHFGYTGHDFHGLTVGPDGKLYFSIGDRGVNVLNYEGERLAYQDFGAVYRCNFDGSDLEFVHGGLRNPQELAFDELGNLFTGDNDCDNGDFERLVYVVEGGETGWRIGHQHAPIGAGGVWIQEGWWKLRDENPTEFLLPPVGYIEDGPSGIAYYPGTGLSPEYKGHLFVTHFKGSIATSGVYTYTVNPNGAGFDLDEKKVFLKGVLPTDVTFAPDGKFYVLDWVDGWPKSNKGRVYALSHPDHVNSEIVKTTEKIIGEGMEGRSAKELAELLSHPNWNVRLEAQLELADRGNDSVKVFSAVALDASKGLYARLHGTWGLGILAERGSNAAKRVIKELALSKENEVRVQAVKLIGDHDIKSEYKLLLSYLKDPYARVQYFAAQGLGKFGRAAAAKDLIELARANDSKDVYLQHAIVMGLVGTKNKAVLAEAAADKSRSVRLAALLTYRRLGDASISRFLSDSDKTLVFAAARAINDEAIEAAFPALAAMIDNELSNDPILGRRALNANYRLGKTANAQALAHYATRSDTPESLRVEALNHLAEWEKPLQRDRLIGVYRPLSDRDAGTAIAALDKEATKILESDSGIVQAKAISTYNALGASTIKDQLYGFVKDSSRDGAARVAAFNSLKDQNDPRMDEIVTYASQSEESGLRLATLPLVADRSPEEAEKTLALMVKGSFEEQRAAYDALSKTNQPFAARLLAESLGRLAKNEVPIAAQLELIDATENSPHAQVQAAYKAYQAAVAADSDPLAPYRFALEGGRGRSGFGVFNNNKIMACIRCHITTGPGEAAGPNLANVGLRLDRENLLESIVNPNAKIADGFDNAIVTLKDGTTKVGIVTSDTDDTLTIRLADQSTVAIAKSDISNRNSMPSSMPNIFGQMLSRTQLRDVMEFLVQRKSDPNARGGHGE